MRKEYALLEAAMSCGSPTRGSEYAYDALCAAGLGGIFPHAAQYPMEKQVSYLPSPPELRCLDAVMAANRALRENVLTALHAQQYPIVIGGDHSIAMGTLAALGEYYGADSLALVYIDAHSDIHTEKTSASHFIHGMDLAAACGLCCDALMVGRQKVNLYGRNIYILGARSVDPPEYDIVREQGVHLYHAWEIKQRGLDSVLAEIVPQLAGKRLHISFDVDVLDPAVFLSTGYRIRGGWTFAQLYETLRLLLPMSVSFECVEYNPMLDLSGEDGEKLLTVFRLLRDIRG